MDEKYTEIFIKGDNTYAVVLPDGKKKDMSREDIIAKEADALKDVAAKTAGRKGR